jgi:hypothetical protein
MVNIKEVKWGKQSAFRKMKISEIINKVQLVPAHLQVLKQETSL